MFNADQLNARIKKVSRDLDVKDVNRVRGIVVLERIVARLVSIERTFEKRNFKVDSLYQAALGIDTEYMKKSFDFFGRQSNLLLRGELGDHLE